jgi:hypothetical protein
MANKKPLRTSTSPLRDQNNKINDEIGEYLSSPQGSIRGEGNLQQSFNKTNLDLTNPNPTGGPNRINSSNIPSGRYEDLKSSNINGWSFKDQFPGSALKDKDGNPVKTTLNQWTPNNKYLDSFRGKPKPTS